MRVLSVPGRRIFAEGRQTQHCVCQVSNAALQGRSCVLRRGLLHARPIDFVAAGITGVLSHHRSGFDAYHVVNPHWDDGVSLDAIVGWVAEARGGLRTIQDYSQWCVAPPPPAQSANAGWHHASLMRHPCRH